MNTKSIETTCYAHKSFQDLSNCISEEVAKTESTSRNTALYERYTNGAKLLELEVRNKKIKDEEARLLLSILRSNLEEEDRQRLSQSLGNLGKIYSPQNSSSYTTHNNTDGYNVERNRDSSVYDNKVYREDECIGAVIMGKCQGSVIDKGGYPATCNGEWINGMCTGPMF
jgi:hypothetical protein